MAKNQSSKKQNDQDLIEVRKNNAAIHIDTTSLTLTHRKAFNILIWNAWHELDKNKVHTMEVWELMSMLDHHDIHKLKVELEKLPTIGVTWNLLRDDGWPIDSGACALVAGFRMVGNVFRYSFFEDFRPLLKNPKIWTKIKIEVANLFKSSYALALYETCFRFAKVGSTGFISVDEWRDLLGVPNSEYYRRFSNVNKDIMRQAIKEINKLSDIIISPEYKRKGKGGAIVEVKFNIEKKPNFRIEKHLKLPQDNNITKEHVQRQVASFAPDSKAAQELEEAKYKPVYIIFNSPPSDQTKSLLKEEGFVYWSSGTAWVNKRYSPARLFKIKSKMSGEDIADSGLGFPETKEQSG